MTQRQAQASILIVDDTPDNLRLLSEMLLESGYQVCTAMSGEQALQAVTAMQPDMILLDIRMPRLDGYEVCRRLKENRDTAAIPIIFLSAMGAPEDKIRGFQVGGVDYITKPVQVEEVRARIETHLTLRNLQRGLQRQIEERDGLIDELDAFAHTVAHDLKNPLALIIGNLELLRMDLPSPTKEQAGALDALERTVAKMDSIIEELMLLSGVRKTEVVPAPIDMEAIVAEVRQRLDRLIVETGAEVEMPESWPHVLGHWSWIEEVWVNYLSNACKYGGRPPRIELGWAPVQPDLQDGCEAAGGMARFWVHDNGPGIAREDQHVLFAPFTRLTQVQVEGYGLGLSIVQRIITKLNGQVGVESEPGAGTTFYFTLPLAAFPSWPGDFKASSTTS
jgi:two-component system, sensor histidine kinase and response regulator